MFNVPNSQSTFDLQQALNIDAPSPVHTLITPDYPNIQLDVKRDDLLHSVISGNKWRKLKYALLKASNDNVEHIISFGGGYSNHLHALAFTCHRLGISMTAIVRGDYTNNLTPMLNDISAWGSNIQYVDRKTYQRRENKDYISELIQQYERGIVIPEGGSQSLALSGVSEIVHELQQFYDIIIAPVGSAGTLAGIIDGVSNTNSKVLGIGVLKGQGYLEELVSRFLPNESDNWQINHQYHFAGYAKSTPELVDFCQRFEAQHKITIEPVYSGKMFFAIDDLLSNGFFPSGSRILAIHTGGLQGKRS